MERIGQGITASTRENRLLQQQIHRLGVELTPAHGRSDICVILERLQPSMPSCTGYRLCPAAERFKNAGQTQGKGSEVDVHQAKTATEKEWSLFRHYMSVGRRKERKKDRREDLGRRRTCSSAASTKLVIAVFSRSADSFCREIS